MFNNSKKCILKCLIIQKKMQKSAPISLGWAFQLLGVFSFNQKNLEWAGYLNLDYFFCIFVKKSRFFAYVFLLLDTRNCVLLILGFISILYLKFFLSFLILVFLQSVFFGAEFSGDCFFSCGTKSFVPIYKLIQNFINVLSTNPKN